MHTDEARNQSRQLPLISIIITSYNYGHTLAAAIESACAQDYLNLEILVLDNASTDGSIDILRHYRDHPKLRCYVHPENLGATKNHNLGVQLARGEFIRFLSADDVLKPDSISQTYQFLQASPAIDIPYTEIEFIDLNGSYLASRHSLFPAGYRGLASEFAHLLSYGCYAAFETLLIHRSIWEHFGPLDERLTAADYEIVVRWAAGGLRFGYLPYASLQFRVHDTQESGPLSYLATGKSIVELLALYEKYLTTENASLLFGHEYAIERHLFSSVALAQERGFVVDGALTAQIAEIDNRLANLRLQNAHKPFVPKLSIILLANDSVADVNTSLEALGQQSLTEWEVLIVHPPSLIIGPVVDPSGRIRLVTLYASISDGHALNTAMYQANGNCFAFLRAGTSFSVNHCAQLLEAFAHAQLILTPAKLCVSSDNDEEQFPLYIDCTNRNAMTLAPTAPLESIAFTKALIDRHQGFLAEDVLSACWDLQLRFRDQEQPYFLRDSSVQLREACGMPTRFGRFPEPAIDIQRCYTRWTTDNARVNEARVAYMRDMLAHSSPLAQVAVSADDHRKCYARLSAQHIVRQYGLAPLDPVPTETAR